jgi:hypothetical protein
LGKRRFRYAIARRTLGALSSRPAETRSSNLSASMGGLDMNKLMLGAAVTLMNARAQLITAALLSSSLLASPAAAIEPEKQPTFSNIQSGSLCGTHSPLPSQSVHGPGWIPPGNRARLRFCHSSHLDSNPDRRVDRDNGPPARTQWCRLPPLCGHQDRRDRVGYLFFRHAIQNDVASGSDIPFRGERRGRVRIPREGVSRTRATSK